jgi:hypothetical protein
VTAVVRVCTGANSTRVTFTLHLRLWSYMSSRKITNSHNIYRCGDNPTKAERNSCDEGALNVKCERNIESFNQETQERIIAEA